MTGVEQLLLFSAAASLTQPHTPFNKEISSMHNVHENDMFTQPDQYSAAPPPSVEPRQPRSGLRTGAILLLALMIAIVFGIGLFAGWQFGTGSRANTGVLQPGIPSGPTLPALKWENLDAVREAGAGKGHPGGVQGNGPTSHGPGAGAGGIIVQPGEPY